MAGAQITIAANCLDAQRLGYQAISLTHFADAVEPALAAGSKVEIGGSLFGFAGDEVITGLAGIAVSSDIYILLTVAGAAVTASGTITAPTWSTSKQGWYTGANRVIGGLYKDAGGDYTKKWVYDWQDQSGKIKRYGDGTIALEGGARFNSDSTQPATLKKILQIGNWNMDTTNSVAIATGLTWAKIISAIAHIIDDASTTKYPITHWDSTLELYLSITSDGNINLFRKGGGLFDNVNYDSSPFNRGWIFLEYLP